MALSLLGSGSISGLAAGVNGVGKVLQVVQNTYSTEVNTSSTSWTSAGLTATITPTSSSSKVLAFVGTNAYKTGTSSYAGYVSLFRGDVSTGTNLFNSSQGFTYMLTAGEIHWPISYMYLDSPATTSATTYTLALRVSNAGVITVGAQNANTPGVMILVEVAA